MKQECPRCQSTDIVNLSNTVNSPPFAGDMASTVLVPLSVRLCKTLNIHPSVGIVVGSALATAINHTKTQSCTHPIFDTNQYRCKHCSHVFYSVNQSTT